MKNILKTCVAIFLAGAIDGSLGILFVFVFSKIFHYSAPFWIYLVGITLAAVAPDTDLLWQKIREKKADSNHRKYLHYPLGIIPLFAILAHFSFFWAYMVCSCLLVHFIHDSVGNKENRWGVRWLTPFSWNYYQFFGKKGKGRLIVCSWSSEEIEKRKSTSLNSWLNKNYLKFPPESFIGVLVCVCVLFVVFTIK